MTWSSLPPRSAPMPHGKGLEGGTGLVRRVPLRAVPADRPRPARRETGFPRAVKLLIRTRAGGGDPEQAVCECCGKWLGRSGGEVQHRLARKMGGSRNPVVNGVTNGVLLCGNRYEDCHKRCEDRDPAMEAAGFWIRDGKGPDHDPRLVPLLVRTSTGEIAPCWLTEDGGKAWERPEMAA